MPSEKTPTEPATQAVVDEVIQERNRQDRIWGGASHDDTHSVWDFLGFLHTYIRKTESELLARNPIGVRSCLIKIAALAVATVEMIDRKKK